MGFPQLSVAINIEKVTVTASQQQKNTKVRWMHTASTKNKLSSPDIAHQRMLTIIDEILRG